MVQKATKHAALGERIRRARLAAGITNAADAARALHIQPNTYYRYERGELAPRTSGIEAIARLTGTTADALLRGTTTELHPSYVAWLATPRGQSASREARAFLEALPLGRYAPSAAFYDLVLLAFEQGLTADEAVLAAETTARFR